MTITKYIGGVALAATLTVAACTKQPETDAGPPPESVKSMAATVLKVPTKQINGITIADKGNIPGKFFDGGIAADEDARRNLAEFDTLDFEYFTNQDWVGFHESHADNIVVTWPDGHDTYGLDTHIEDMKGLFVHAPDTRIRVHPIRIGSGDWTAVYGVMEGTFSMPMPLPGGGSMEPTGKAFALPMATFGYWKDGVMVQEWLLWDNQTYMKQMGIGQ